MHKELITIIIAPLIIGAIWYYKRKQKEKQQERLNKIK